MENQKTPPSILVCSTLFLIGSRGEEKMTRRVDFLVSSWKSVFSNPHGSSKMTLC